MDLETISTLVKIAGGLGAAYATFKAAALFIVAPLRERAERRRELAAKVHLIYKELSPNGGFSLKDVIGKVQSSIGRIENRQRAWLTVHDKPVFETDATGNCVWANRCFLKLLNASFEEIAGRGWRNFLAPENAEDVFNEWSAAVADGRDFKRAVVYRNASGATVHTLCECLATRDETGVLWGYVGTLTVREKSGPALFRVAAAEGCESASFV